MNLFLVHDCEVSQVSFFEFSTLSSWYYNVRMPQGYKISTPEI